MTSNALKRPTTNSQESPPKRQKALESSSDDSGMGYVLPEFIPAPQKPLEPLPLPILLLVAAQDSQSKLRSLQGKLTVLGTKATGEKIAGHAEAYIDSMRLTASTIVSLRTVINSSQNAAGTSIGVGGGRLELRARCQLAEILIRYMGNTKSGVGSTPQRAGMAEVEDVIAKGLIAAYKHESFADYKYRLIALSAEHSLLASNTKFAKSTIKRFIAEILSLPTLNHPAWLYQFHLTLASMATDENDYPGTLSALRDVEGLASKRGDNEMIWASRVLLARAALGEREFRLAGALIDSIAEMMGFERAPAPNEHGVKVEVKSESTLEEGSRDQGYLGRQMRIQFVIIYCLYQAQIGKVKLAKDKLKIAHGLLDQKVLEEGETGGWVKIPIRAAENQTYSSPVKPLSSSSTFKTGSESALESVDSVMIMTSPKSLMYGFAFLVSVAVHRDPFGSKPRSKLFATEGLKIVDAMLAGESESLPAHSPPSQLSAALKTTAKIKIDLLLYFAELEIMRSSYTTSLSHYTTAISTARSYPGLWDQSKIRLTLGMGCLAQAQMRNEEAVRCFEVVIELGKKGGGRKGEWDDLVVLAKMSILIIRIGEGAKVRVSDSTSSIGMSRIVSGSSVHSTPTSSTFPAHSTPTQTSSQLASLSTLAKEIIHLTTSPTASHPPLRILGEFVAALTKGEIIKAKQHLSNALNLANTGLANHSKAVMLALLAGLFIHTRNDQALKMLTAAFTILRGMGSKNEDEGDKDNIVGNSRLGLWVGEKLLEIYTREGSTSKAKRQESYNAAHRRVLERETIAAAGFSFSPLA